MGQGSAWLDPSPSRRSDKDFLGRLQADYFYEGSGDEVPPDDIPFTDDLQGLFLERLASAEQWARFDDQPKDVPDKDDAAASIRLATSAHLSAARAVALLRAQGVDSEDVRDSLGRANHAASLLEDGPDLSRDLGLLGLSTLAAHGIVAFELSRLAAREGNYAEALHRFAVSLSCTHHALDDWGQGDWWWSDLEEWTANLRADDAGRLIATTLRDVRANDWMQVAADLETIRSAWGSLRDLAPPWGVEPEESLRSQSLRSGPVDTPVQFEGATMDLVDYCLIARGRAAEKITASQLRDYQALMERTASEDRLRLYFLDEGLWGILPEKTRQHLVNADRMWFSLGGEEAILAELTVATERLCKEAIWDPLDRRAVGREHEDFDQLRAELTAKWPGYDPALPEFVRICEMKCFYDFLDELGLDERRRDYFLKVLPKSLRALAAFRRHAVHKRWSIARAAVGPHLKRFLGIGEPGVLPELADLKRRTPRVERKRPTPPDLQKDWISRT